MQLYIDTASTTVTVKNSSFMIVNESTQRLISPRRVSSIAILTNVMLNTSAIKLAASFEIPIYYYDRMGNVLAQLRGPSFLKQSRLRYKQIIYMNAADGKTWAIHQLGLKTELQMQTFERYGRSLPTIRTDLRKISDSIGAKKEDLLKIDPCHPKVTNTIMGVEGGIARLYFQGLNLILPKEYQFTGRNRRPAKDYFNASLNYLYGMTYGEITKAIHAAGLDTFVGGLHCNPYKENLVFDSIEPFRPIIDRLLIEMCQNKCLNEAHFKPVKNGFWLSKSGKRMLIGKYNDYLQQRILFQGRVKPIQHHIYANTKNLREQINNFNSNVPDTL